MQTYDSIVIGNGLTGAALSYELAKQGQSVLLMDDGNPHSGTRYSYGGIGYWAGTTDLTDMLFRAGIARHRELPEELGADTQLRELDLLLTVEKGADIDALKAGYEGFRTPPKFVSAQVACELEPLLNPESIDGAFVTPHAHVDPMSVVSAYNQAFRRLGGHHQISAVTGLVRVSHRITGITTQTQAYPAQRVIVAAGAHSLQLLQTANVQVPLYFTHAEIVETAPLPFDVRTFVMPATNARIVVENRATDESEWQQPNHQVMPPVLEAGIIQFRNKTARIGQISRFHTAYTPPEEASLSEAKMRRAMEQKIPKLAGIAGTWRHCLVSFTQDGLPLLGPVSNTQGLYLFSGFTGPFALVPPTAQHFAKYLVEGSDTVVEKLLLSRLLPSDNRV
ncbi:MAG: FAD-dependent oxidoreductase [Cyanobacteria bacterium J06632_3]